MSRQKHKGKKRPRSWHRRWNGPDRAFARAVKAMDKAEKDRRRELMNTHRLCPCGCGGCAVCAGVFPCEVAKEWA